MEPMLLDTAFVGTSPEDAQAFIVNILQSSTDYSIIGKGLDGTILLWNEGARRLYGYEAGELLGKVKSDVLHTPEDIAAGRPRAIMEAALRLGRWEGVLSRVRRDGERFLARAIMTPRFDASARHVGYLLISRDITNEIPTPQADEKFRGLLESAPDAMMVVNPEGRVIVVNSQTEKLFGYTRDELLGQPVEIDCKNVVEEVATALRPSAAAKGLRFEVSVSPPSLAVRADRRALSQILLNLANNAIKFTEKGHVSIVAARRVDMSGRVLVAFSVSDTGIGICVEDQARLFQAFAQVAGSSKQRQEGTGLGLHLSRKLAELLGGHIACQSAPGKGSTFTLVLVEG